MEQDQIRKDIIGKVSGFEKRSHIGMTKIVHFLGKINKMISILRYSQAQFLNYKEEKKSYEYL